MHICLMIPIIKKYCCEKKKQKFSNKKIKFLKMNN